MSIMRCPECDENRDIDFVEFIEVNGIEICRDCYENIDPSPEEE